MPGLIRLGNGGWTCELYLDGSASVAHGKRQSAAVFLGVFLSNIDRYNDIEYTSVNRMRPVNAPSSHVQNSKTPAP